MLFLTTFADYKSEGVVKVIALSITAVFWLSLLLGYIFMITFYVKSEKPKGLVGVISFFTNKYGFVADCLLIASVVLTVALVLLNVYSNLIYSLLVSVIFFAFNLHAVLNGKVFRAKFLKGDMKK